MTPDPYTLLCLTKGFPLTEEDAQELRDWAEELKEKQNNGTENHNQLRSSTNSNQAF